jgi:hypothetical protein
MKTLHRNLLILLIAVIILTACGSSVLQEPTSSFAGKGNDGSGAPVALPAMEAPSGSDVANYSLADKPASQSNTERIVIQNADLTIVVKDPLVKMNEIGALARRLGGFVVASNMSQTTMGNNAKVPEGTISIRVPAKDLDAALAEIKANTVEVQNENRSGQDVTDKYVDLTSQLKAKQAAETKLYEILQKTEKAEDTLMVFNQLTQVQSDIEVLKGQINYYEQAAALSAISVRLIAEESIQPIVIAGWRPQGVARDAVQSLVEFFQNFVEFLIWLIIYIIPVGAVVITLLALLWRLLRWFWRKVFPRKITPVVTPPVKTE